MKNRVLIKILGDPQAKILRRLKKRVGSINVLADKYKKMSDKELKKQTVVFRERLEGKKTTLDDILPEAFAAMREAAERTIGNRHFDVQLIGGMVLHEGNVSEMKTGEGKTLVATLPAYLNALASKGVHIITVNDYLAQRDCGWNGQAYYALGISTACIIAEQSFIYDPEYTNNDHEDERFRHLRPCTRKEAY
ncbi:MAG TPA: preprotein translocase subunit SecA, partial [Candidatus Saccharimonadales bacterium]|nr:preprotein translocase subunit SecA [Candidatus Saccharimonadales bacterium]